MLTRLAIVTAALCLCGSACSISGMQDAFTAAQGNFEKTIAVADGPVSLDTATASGDIIVRPINEPVVHVVGHVRVYSGGWSWAQISPQDALARLQ